MAQQTHVVLIDDVDGSTATQTVYFSLDGANYAIDLSDENAEKLRSDMSAWVSSGQRETSTRNVAKKVAGKAPGRNDTARIRAWARDAGMAVSERGRIASPIIAAFNQANQ